MYRRPPLMPSACPVGFGVRYTVVPGDTFYSIARLFRVRLEALAVNNPHIPDPNILVPGDVLCVPSFSTCAVALRPRLDAINFLISGTVSINAGPVAGRSLSAMANLPDPSSFGDYDRYTVYAMRTHGSFFDATGKRLSKVPDSLNMWAARIDNLKNTLLATDTRVVISANKGDAPPPGSLLLLEGNLFTCG